MVHFLLRGNFHLAGLILEELFQEDLYHLDIGLCHPLDLVYTGDSPLQESPGDPHHPDTECLLEDQCHPKTECPQRGWEEWEDPDRLGRPVEWIPGCLVGIPLGGCCLEDPDRSKVTRIMVDKELMGDQE